MQAIDKTWSVGDITKTIPGAARAFERLGIDYCCRGRDSLERACAERGIGVEAALELLEEGARGRPVPTVPSEPDALIRLILERHHLFERAELERLLPLSEKVRRVHGPRHPELVKIDECLLALAEDLLPHMLKEERVLFPAIEELQRGERPVLPFGSIAMPLTVMLREHDAVGELLRALELLTNGYVPPEDSCASYRALFAGLAELQADIHAHVHLENHVLFPLAEALEAKLSSSPH